MIATMTNIRICAAWSVNGFDFRRREWVDGTLFFHTRNHHILDDALNSGSILDVDLIREETGVGQNIIDQVEHLVEGVGGSVISVSSFHDWIRILLPRSLVHGDSIIIQSGISKDFLDASKDEVHGYIVHHVAAALGQKGLLDYASHILFSEPPRHSDESVTNDDISSSRMRSWDRRRLHEDGENVNEFTAIMLYGSNYDMFAVNKSEAAMNIGTWLNCPVMFIQCMGENQAYLNGKNDADCTEVFDEVTIVLSPMYSDDINAIQTIRLNITTDIMRKTCGDVPTVCFESDYDSSLDPTDSTYVYGIPLYKYALPNVLYQAVIHISLAGVQLGTITNPLYDSVPKIYNYFNSSARAIRDLYGVDAALQGTAETVQGTSLFVTLADSAVNVSSLNEYLSLMKILEHRELQIDSAIAPNNASLCQSTSDQCAEEMLDVETLQSFAPNATTIFAPSNDYSEDDNKAVEMFLSFIESVINADVRPDVVSLSWARDYTATGLTVQALENTLKKLASLGVSIVAATGDGGSSSFPGVGCWTSVSPFVANFPGTSWPASSPWVTSVGATQLLAVGPELQTQEVACMKSTNGGVSSSGGFSGTWLNITTPEWQQKVVQEYLQSNNASTFSGFPSDDIPTFNRAGRGYPDIAAYGAFFPMLLGDGSLNSQAGTSLSAPIVASLFTLANQKLVSEGYSKIGYANPMLYWMADECQQAFNDITLGNNQIGIDGLPCAFGYPAAPGWDPVTGLGSINFAPFVKCVQK